MTEHDVETLAAEGRALSRAQAEALVRSADLIAIGVLGETARKARTGDVVPVDVSAIPGFGDVAEFLQEAPHYFVDGEHYGVPHGYGGNLLMYDTETITPAPTSWAAVFDPTQMEAYSGLVTAYDAPIYIADAALYLKSARPELGITDVYELTQEQFDAAVEVLKAQAPHVGKYWSLFADEIDNFTNGSTAIK